MAECPQFQLMPQVVPIYRPQPPPSAFPPMPGQPIFPMPTHFGYPPFTWSPFHHYPPPLQNLRPAYNHIEEKGDSNGQQPTCNNHNTTDDSQNEMEHSSQQSQRQVFTRNVSNKIDTRHEEFRKYLEEMGILSTFTNIITDMYQDPLRPSDPLGYIRDKLNCTRPESIELSNLRMWCKQYQIKTMRLEKELNHVIERLRKHEPYITDDSLFNESSDCKTCVLDITKQGRNKGNSGRKH